MLRVLACVLKPAAAVTVLDGGASARGDAIDVEPAEIINGYILSASMAEVESEVM
jgi:hypothetical protein